MNDNKKEIRRIRLEDLDTSLQNILLNRISKDDPIWKKIQDLIDDLYKKTHIEKKNITITIVQSANQTIHVYVPRKTGGIDYTSTFTCLQGTTYEIEVIANKGYIAGTPNVSRRGVFNNNKTINATPATKSNATVTITQSAHQTIHVYTPKKSGGTDHTSTFTCPRGTTYEAEVIAESGYVAGALNVSGSGTINSDMSINANPAIGMATVTIVQSAHQTIHVYTPYKGGTDHTSAFTCSIGTRYEVEVIADRGYNAGTPNTNGGTVNSNITINATGSTVANATVTIVQSPNQTIHVYTPQKAGGTDHTSSFTCQVGTTYEAEVIAENGYNAGTLNVSGGGVINSNKTINATSAVKREVPTGRVHVGGENIFIFTVPAGIKVIAVMTPTTDYGQHPIYIGVIPNSVHKLKWRVKYGVNTDTFYLECLSHNKIQWAVNQDYYFDATLYWSPEINTHTPDVTDY